MEKFIKPSSHRPGEGLRFRINLALVILLVCGIGFRAEAAAPTVDPAVCRALVNYTPSDDVTYKPGVDAEGHAVAPADLPGQQQIQLPKKLNIPLTVNLAKTLNLDTTAYPYNQLGEGTEAVLGTLTVDGNNVSFNGQPLSDTQQGKLAALCAKKK